jgi:predicted TIM-barrel fold metal-dependent hydrolase
VVDAHAHLLPTRLAEKVRAFFAPIADQLVYPIDHDAVLRRHEADGIAELWNLPYAHKPGVADGLNEASAAIAARPGPVAIVGGATVHPGDDDPGGVVRRAVDELGLRVLKLHCSVGSFDADDRRLDPVWALAAERRVPVVVHVGHADSGLTEAGELAALAIAAGRHPGAAIVIAHCGHPAVDRALDVLEAHPNVHADLTPVLGSPPDLPLERIAAVADRLLFGTDAPNTGISAADHLAAVRALPLGPDQIEAVTGGTARRLTAPSLPRP